MSSAVAGNRSGSLRVRVDDAGTLLGIHIDRDELRYGGTSLATAILELYEIARADAVARRRSELLDYGIAPDVVDRIHPQVARTAARRTALPDRSWLREL